MQIAANFIPLILWSIQKNVVNLRRKPQYNTIMTTITLKYDARNSLLKSIIDLAVKAGAIVVDVTTSKTKRCGLDEALEDVEQGRVYKADSVEDMMKQILG